MVCHSSTIAVLAASTSSVAHLLVDYVRCHHFEIVTIAAGKSPAVFAVMFEIMIMFYVCFAIAALVELTAQINGM